MVADRPDPRSRPQPRRRRKRAPRPVAAAPEIWSSEPR
jgi:hypothetical protein